MGFKKRLAAALLLAAVAFLTFGIVKNRKKNFLLLQEKRIRCIFGIQMRH